MAIEDIFKALDEQADAECEQIVGIARTQAEAIVSEARAEAARIMQQKLETAEAAARRKTAQVLNAARIESMRRLGTVREEAIERVYQDAAERLVRARSTPEYGEIFKVLASEALADTQGDRVLAVDPADKALAEDLRSTASPLTVATEVSTSGGVVVNMDGGRVIRRNTFESRLEKMHTFADARVAEILER